MNENFQLINLFEFTEKDPLPFGNDKGREAFSRLRDYVEQHAKITVFGISLAEIRATDASFPRESIIALAKQFRKEKGFYLEGFDNNKDLEDNWNYPAVVKEQPLIVWQGLEYKILGPQPSSSNMAIFDFVYENSKATASEVSSKLEITVHNASTKLKKLYDGGYILRSEEVAETGGKEFVYHAIKKSA